MRKVMLLVVVLVDCSKAEAPPADTAAMAPAPAPAMLTAADVAGTWSGTSMAETGDSVTGRWTVTRVSDTEARLVFEGSTDSVTYAMTYDADSMMATSQPFADPAAPKGSGNVVVRSVGRLRDGKLVGTSTTMAAAKPDSVIARGRWEATRVP